MDGTDVPATRFRFINARVIEIAEAQKLPAPWPESLEQLATLREESESKQRGTVAAVGIECPPLGVQFVPFGSLRGLSPLKILPNWKDILKRDIETGKKFTRFGS
jgi:splicing suppressor protein 51